MNLRKVFRILLLAMTVCLVSSTAVQAQLHDDMRDLFESMLPDLDKDVRKKFEQALKKNTPNVRFTAEEFLKFKKNPANPFDGLDNVDPDDLDDEIILRFELPSLRGRPISRLERQHRSVLEPLRPLAASLSDSIVRFKVGQKQTALGTVISADGLVITKASELRNRKKLRCELSDGSTVSAELKRVDRVHDLALVQLNRSGLKPVTWSDKQPLLGSFVLTPDNNDRVLGIGSYSSRPRSTKSGERAFLGVQPEAVAGGIRVERITQGTAASEAGLQDGDVITRIDGSQMTRVNDLVNYIRMRRPGDEISIEYRRGGTNGITTAKLASQNVSGEVAAQFKMMNRLGAIPSRRGDDFPQVFQHDTPLFPEQCGGPIIDLEGNVLGINIARAGRAASYAIPSSHLKTLITSMVRESVAAKDQ